MDISQEFIIDMALNVGGYLIAGAISVLIYSLFAGRRKNVAVAQSSEPIAAEQQAIASTVAETEKRRVEFIKLGHENATGSAPEGKSESMRETTSSDRRDRAEIIRIARGMLKAGATNERIKRVLPISEAELSLLSMSRS